MSGIPNLGCARPIRGSEGADVKRGTYRRRSIVCYSAPIRMEAEGEGEDRFGVDNGRIVEPAMAGSRSGAARPLPRATTGAWVSVPRVPAAGPRIWPGTMGTLQPARASRAGDCRETAVHAAQPGESGNGTAVARDRGRPPVLLARLTVAISASGAIADQ